MENKSVKENAHSQELKRVRERDLQKIASMYYLQLHCTTIPVIFPFLSLPPYLSSLSKVFLSSPSPLNPPFLAFDLVTILISTGLSSDSLM